MITCREAARLASRSLDEPLGLKDRIALRLHLTACTACAQYMKGIRVLHWALTRGVERWDDLQAFAAASLSTEDRERMSARIAQALAAEV